MGEITHMYYIVFIDTQHTGNKVDENNAKIAVDDSLLLETGKTQANSLDSAANKPVDMNKVGQSVFYDCLEISPTAEKQDFMKPEQSDTDEESKLIIIIIFDFFVIHSNSRVIYLLLIRMYFSSVRY